MASDKHTKTQAVIYTRVSSVKQTVEGDGLRGQETRCRDFARRKGYQVEAVFQDDVSGSLTSRPGMKLMLAHLSKNKKRGTVVIIDDVSRLARGLEAHLALRAAIANAGGILESPSIEFGDDPDSQLVEYLLATVSQHARGKNAQQTVNRMRARLVQWLLAVSSAGRLSLRQRVRRWQAFAARRTGGVGRRRSARRLRGWALRVAGRCDALPARSSPVPEGSQRQGPRRSSLPGCSTSRSMPDMSSMSRGTSLCGKASMRRWSASRPIS